MGVDPEYIIILSDFEMILFAFFGINFVGSIERLSSPAVKEDKVIER